jgi:hypothetical protein
MRGVYERTRGTTRRAPIIINLSATTIIIIMGPELWIKSDEPVWKPGKICLQGLP